MSDQWEELTWGDIATLEYGKGIRGYQDAEGPYPVYGTNGHIGWHDSYLYSPEGVIVGRKGVYRGIHYSKKPFYVIDTAFYLKPKCPDDLNLRWAFYQLLTHDINAMDSGSAIPSTSRESFYQLDVLIPSRVEQDRIADVLSSFDDKIELNRRMNRTLEELARAIFKAWFVDFEPVKAKTDGATSFPGMPQDIFDQLPNTFVPSDLGPIPDGWHVQDMRDTVDIVKGRSYKSSELSESNTALVTLKSFLRGGGYRDDGLKPYTGKFKPEQVVEPGEIVVAYTDVTQQAAVIGKPAIVRKSRIYNKLVASLDTAVVRPISNNLPKSFLYCLFKTEDFQAPHKNLCMVCGS